MENKSRISGEVVLPAAELVDVEVVAAGRGSKEIPPKGSSNDNVAEGEDNGDGCAGDGEGLDSVGIGTVGTVDEVVISSEMLCEGEGVESLLSDTADPNDPKLSSSST